MIMVPPWALVLSRDRSGSWRVQELTHNFRKMVGEEGSDQKSGALARSAESRGVCRAR